MILADYIAISPLIILALAPVVVMLSIAVVRNHFVCQTLSIGFLIAALAAIWNEANIAPRIVTPLLIIDRYGLFYMAIILLSGLAILTLGRAYLSAKDAQPEEFYVLFLTAIAGACVMTVSMHFMSFYLGLEIMSVSQYGLIAYSRRDRRGTEAGVKYLILAAATAAFMLFGMALVYAELGTMRFSDLAAANTDLLQNKIVLLGAVMILASVAFKLSVVPFHLWTPDVYEGAPAPVTAMTASISKIAVLAFLIRFFAVQGAPISESMQPFIAFGAATSMLLGNVMALIQTNIKRLLAYSSIAHMGYLSIAVLIGGSVASDTTAFYLAAYAASTVGAFGVITILSAHTGPGRDIERIEDYRGLFSSQPVLAVALAVSVLSMAGIPFTAGFVGKFMVVASGAEAGRGLLLVLLALSSVIGVYYYLRIAVLVFSKPFEDGAGHGHKVSTLTAPRKLVLAGLATVTLVLGVFPAPLLKLIHGFGFGG